MEKCNQDNSDTIKKALEKIKHDQKCFNNLVSIGPRGPIGPTGSQGMQGPQGVQGITGPTGKNGTGVNILGSYNSFAELHEAHPTGNVGDAYMVGTDLYVWDNINKTWKDVGNIKGPTGPKGDQGASASDIPIILFISTATNRINFDTLYQFGAHPTPADFTSVGNTIKATRTGIYEMTLSGTVIGEGRLEVTNAGKVLPTLSVGTYSTPGVHSFSQSTILSVQVDTVYQFNTTDVAGYEGFTLIIKRIS